MDLVHLDGVFTLYLPVLRVLEPHLRPGAIVLGENAVADSADYLDYVNDPANGHLSLPLPFDERRGNLLSVRTG